MSVKTTLMSDLLSNTLMAFVADPTSTLLNPASSKLSTMSIRTIKSSSTTSTGMDLRNVGAPRPIEEQPKVAIVA
jgi:hypothetical protein